MRPKSSTRKPTTPTGWKTLSATTINDPRVRKAKVGAIPQQIVVTQLIDDEGQHWERYGDEAPVLVGRPPVRDPDR